MQIFLTMGRDGSMSAVAPVVGEVGLRVDWAAVGHPLLAPAYATQPGSLKQVVLALTGGAPGCGTI